MDLTEKKWLEVSPQTLTSNGDSDGTVTIADTSLFKVKQKVILKANTEPNLELEVKRVVSSTVLKVGPRSSNIDDRSDLSDYTTAKSTTIQAPTQARPRMNQSEIAQATYSEEPALAVRTVLVDKTGAYASLNGGGGSGNLDVVETLVYDYSTGNVTDAAYVQILATLSDDVKKIEIFDSSGVPLYFALGAESSEADKFVIFPGGNGLIDCEIDENARLSLKAVDDSAVDGLLIINFYG
jgi:hypothetical protein